MEIQETKGEEHKRFRTVVTVMQSSLICFLIVLVMLMMTQIDRLQGTARVVNYAGIVRGATQRLVKLEITGEQNDELIAYLDEILTDLKYGNGDYKLVSLKNGSYHDKLDKLILYWNSLKKQIELVRRDSAVPEDVAELVEMSEIYFKMADETVRATEEYSEKIADRIQIIEWISAVDMCLLLCIIIGQTFSAMRMRKKNQILARKAYIDVHTGLQNKNRCEELLNNKKIIKEPTACLMFDINNLKATNDSLGHSVGDRLIADFAGAIRKVVRKEDFAGRYGGDEFIVVIYKVEEDTVQDVLTRLYDEVERYNALEGNIPISYAGGCAVSTDYKNCTFRKLFDEADRCMYVNKQKMKELEV